ncbi:MAG TPA: CheB methylesterase domain-containing protein, partial [bacterium]|nr:CheB methylesterase domain-containing protein [bacterium]
KQSNYTLRCYSGEKVSGHCPSVDVLFQSVAACAGGNALGIILTGMGSDGAKGLLEMHLAGALTLAQRPEGCPVYSMPRAAVDIGAVRAQLSIEGIAAYINRSFEEGSLW